MGEALHYEPAHALLDALRAGRVSARELLSQHLARNDALHARLHAVVVTDPEPALAAAQRIDDARARGETLGPLAGLPMTVKDGLDVRGMPARAGNPAFVDRDRDCADAEVVARARAAGAVPWGKTNVPFMLGDIQSYNDIDGTTCNPWDPSLTPGGSSGGAAAALAAGITALEIGSDIGGSLRHPAHFCGVFALKPTHGRLPLAGHVPPPPGIDPEVDLAVVGPMARTARDLRLLFRVLAGRAPDHDPPEPSAAGLRVAVWDEDATFPRARVVADAVSRAADALAGDGADVSRAKPAIGGAELLEAYTRLLFAIVASDAPAGTRRLLRALRPAARLATALGVGPWSRFRTALAMAATPAERAAAAETREALKQRLADFFARFDVIALPVTPVPAFPHDHGEITGRRLDVDGRRVPYLSFLGWIALATALHAPAVVVPAGRTPAGLPVGVQLVGPWGSEERLLDLAGVLERRLGGFTPPPL